MCILYVCVYWYTWIYVYIYAWMYVYIDIHECMGIYIHVINSSIMTITTLLYSHGSYPLFMHLNILISIYWWYGVVLLCRPLLNNTDHCGQYQPLLLSTKHNLPVVSQQLVTETPSPLINNILSIYVYYIYIYTDHHGQY